MTRNIAALAVAFAATAFSQRPTFEAASIKPSGVEEGHTSSHTRTGYIVIKNLNLKGLVGLAYGVREERVSGGPKWIAADRFDVEGRAAGPANNADLLLMLQSTLAERFQLTTHRETILTPGFALTVAKGGLKIHPDKTEGEEGTHSNARGKVEAERLSMAGFANWLSRQLRTPVVDMTDIKGGFTFKLEWTPENPRPSATPDGPPPEPASGPSLYTVLAKELGLKLESKKLPIEMIVIDKAEKPTEN
jgi:uncharacterized protein (TIGR03435 family)